MEVYEEKLECLRKKLIKEKEEAVDNEREKNLQKLDKVYEKHEQ